MLLIFPPVAKICEPPAGIAHLAGVVRGHGLPCTLLDANLEGLSYLLASPPEPSDTWGRRACRGLKDNLAALKDPQLYTNPDRYQRAVADVGRVLDLIGRSHGLGLTLANYQDQALSPLKSPDLLRAAETFKVSIFYPYFSQRLPGLIEAQQPDLVGISLNYLSQALSTFALIGFLKEKYPHLPVVLGGGLVTSWLSNPAFDNPFAALVDHLVAGPGGEALLSLLGVTGNHEHHAPRYDDLPLSDYLSPGLILPYAASAGCYWNKCSFCPETAEGNLYEQVAPPVVLADLDVLVKRHQPRLIHFLDNAVSPALMGHLAEQPPGVDWYGFARVSPLLADRDFCKRLRESGCLMLKLGLESGDQGVLDNMDKGIDLDLVSRALAALRDAGIATCVYLLFGTPSESSEEARKTLEFVRRHHDEITFLNLAVFNMPVCGPDATTMALRDFYSGDLTLYTDFTHPRAWNRREIRRFLDQEFKRDPAVATILRRDPPIFTSNHASFFCQAAQPSLKL
ncbi:MAG: radical SAM protein [Desulfobulbaceae bacterium]|uniref:Radical SAM protein n=1 Tax=Candidatus Desulfatifera sulfidica TaxID=2841691 RepID=A0A8J6NBT0_9BACT|nr:radical SAM protein [Candidatus Desulfatifera sulfidica]